MGVHQQSSQSRLLSLRISKCQSKVCLWTQPSSEMTKAFPEILPSVGQGHSVFGVLPTELRTSLWFLAQKSLSADSKWRGKGSEDRPSLSSEPHREEVLNCPAYAFICPASDTCSGSYVWSLACFLLFSSTAFVSYYLLDGTTGTSLLTKRKVSKRISEQTLKSDERQRCVKLHVTTEWSSQCPLRLHGLSNGSLFTPLE